jgi:hypothetical protein
MSLLSLTTRSQIITNLLSFMNCNKFRTHRTAQNSESAVHVKARAGIHYFRAVKWKTILLCNQMEKSRNIVIHGVQK